MGGLGLIVPTVIVLHATIGTNSLKWLTTDAGSDVSAHRLIDRDGRNFKLVDDEECAHHIGRGFQCFNPQKRASNPNTWSLGIEMENLGHWSEPFTDMQVKMTALQCNEWWGVYGYLPVVGHWALDNKKSDPVGFPWEVFMELLMRYSLGDSGRSRR
jgi:N-acetyl-anhydromuramyl-L-alanine amidase AmpD